jgi:hypothetical protein
MVKHHCPCGNKLSDNTDALPYKARFLADEDVDKPLVRMVDTLIAFMHAHEAGFEAERAFLIRAAATAEGMSEEDAAKGFDTSPSRHDLSKRLLNLLWDYWVPNQRRMFECNECGRILMQSNKGYYFVPYAPETDERGLLESPTDHRSDWS